MILGKESLYRLADQWECAACQEVDTIRWWENSCGVENVGDPLPIAQAPNSPVRPPIESGLWDLTDRVCRGIERRLPDLDPQPIRVFYKAVKEWHDSIGYPTPKVTADGCLMRMECHFQTLFQEAHSVVLEVQQRLSLNLPFRQAVILMLFQKADANLHGAEWKKLPVLEVEEYPNIKGRVGTTGRKEDRLQSYAAAIDWAGWKSLPAWRLLIAARLRQGVEPLLLPLEADNGKPEMLSRVGQCYQAAADAIELGDLRGRKVEGEYRVRPVDFVRWCESEGIEMVPQMRALLDDATADGAGDAGKKTEVKAPERPRFPTPAGAKWRDFEMSFVSGDSLRVKVGQVNKVVTAGAAGFADGRTGRPNKQWDLLKRCSENRGEIEKPSLSVGARAASEVRSKEIHRIKRPQHGSSVQQRKNRLDACLQKYFGISEPAFEWVEDEYLWRANFSIAPERGM